MTTTQNNVALDFSLSTVEAGKRLHIEYTVSNHTQEKILLWDAVVVPEGSKMVLKPLAISTVNGEQPGTVRFIRGYVRPNSRVNIEYPPGLRVVEAGQSIKGSAEVDLPLKSWLAYGAVQPLSGTPTQAVFELQYFPGSHPTTTYQMGDGTTLLKPAQPWSAAVTLHSAPKPIPNK